MVLSLSFLVLKTFPFARKSFGNKSEGANRAF